MNNFYTRWLICLLCLLYVGQSRMHGQGETYNWAWNSGAELHFLPGNAFPQANPQGHPVHDNHSAVISDPCGNLLFYLNRDTVFNALHQPMQNGSNFLANGTLGYSGTPQGTRLIVPIPGTSDQYYIFFVDQFEGPAIQPFGLYNLSYWRVDMNANGGLGELDITGTWLTGGGLTSPTFELTQRLAGTLHANGEDYWVLALKRNTPDQVWAYHVSAAGISFPFVSGLTLPAPIPFPVTQVLLKLSPGGNKLAIGGGPSWIFPPQPISLADFDNSIGILSNQVTLSFPPVPGVVTPSLGELEFSPDGTKLYVLAYNNSPTTPGISSVSHLFQIDLANGNTYHLIASDSVSGFGDIQLGADGRMYIANQQGGAASMGISYLNRPNETGLACEFVPNGLNLQPATSPANGALMPDFLSHYFRPFSMLRDTSLTSGNVMGGICLPDSAYFQIEGVWGLDSVVWDFGDPLVGPVTVEGEDVAHLYSGVGVYAVEALVYRGCPTRPDTLRDTLRVLQPPQLELGGDMTLCEGDSILLQPGLQDGTYFLWQDGSDADSLWVVEEGLYWVEGRNECDTLQDSIRVNFELPLALDLGPDRVLCEGDSLSLNVPSVAGEYLWENGSSDSPRIIRAAGLYILRGTNSCGRAVDSVLLTALSKPEINLGADTLICVGDSVNLEAGVADSYDWSTGDTTSSIIISQAGTYMVTAQNECGTAEDMFMLDTTIPPFLDLGNDTLLCDDAPWPLDASFARARYFWTTGDTTALINVTEAGTYGVQVQNICGTAEDMIQLDRSLPPAVDLGDDQILCEGDSALLDATFADASYLWQDSSRQAVLTVSAPGLYEVLLQNACGSATDAVEIRYETLPALSLPNDTLICEDKVLVVNPPVDDLNIMWEDGSTEPRRELTQPGLYILTASNGCATLRDSLLLETRDCDCSWFVPTIFTPNDDGANETMELGYQCDILEFELSIYDRWGKLVYRTDAPENAWDGRSPKGRPCPEGAYAWVIRTRFNGATENAQRIEKGTVVVVR